MARTYPWTFPLPRTHTGLLLGNGTFGAMIWGERNILRLTLGRADLWDHRGGMPWTAAQSYKNIRACLKRNDEKGLRRLFERTANQAGEPRRPSVIPIGRLELVFPRSVRLDKGFLNIDTGEIEIQVCHGRKRFNLQLLMDSRAPVLVVRCPQGLASPTVRSIPAWRTVGTDLASIGFSKPKRFDTQELSGWVQHLPVDPGVGVGFTQHGQDFHIAVARPAKAQADPRPALKKALARAGSLAQMRKRSQRWWQRFWKTTPRLTVPNPNLQFLYDYGMYKFATFTNPAGTPATLQGPWIEAYQMPPWSSDYHFNINVQMCYQPAYYGNRLQNLLPLFDLIESWQPVLRHNAKVFLGIDDGLMLPHAVDDRCTCMGGFWTGSIDHGCTAWVALMMYRYYRYSLDRDFLRQRAYPFMVGAMRVYEAMLEAKGNQLQLPVSVSPEYRGSRLDAWGKNASFQLAAIHALNEALLTSARVLRQRPKAIWKRIQKRLPRAALIGPAGEERIALWEGTDLEESHRHHSHLAGITPFDSLDLEDSTWRQIVHRSLRHWIYRGPGLWSGWCMPWASAIHSRLGNGDMAELLLTIWQRVFTNPGHGTRHNAAVSGFSLMGIGAVTPRGAWEREIMQMDAGMGAVCAITEMLYFERRGVHYVFHGVPDSWQHASFGPMRTDGAFRVSAERKHGRVAWIRIQSPKGGTFCLHNPWDGAAVVACGEKKRSIRRGRVLRLATRAGETLRVMPAPK